jgi:FKBP-type peptidyl-prolyl cis-trans isomerase FkpA
MKRTAGILLLGLTATALGQAPVAPPAPPPGDLAAFEQYATSVARSAGIADLNWSDAQLEAFIAGLRAAHARRPVPVGDAGRALLGQIQRRVAAVRAGERAEQTDPELGAFFREARSTVAMQRSDSALLYRIIFPGAGPRAQPGDEVVANLNAMMPDGKTPLATLSGELLRVRIGELPLGLDEALQMVALGGRGVFVIPPHLSFGEGEWPQGVAKGTPILLQVEIVDIVAKK